MAGVWFAPRVVRPPRGLEDAPPTDTAPTCLGVYTVTACIQQDTQPAEPLTLSPRALPDDFDVVEAELELIDEEMQNDDNGNENAAVSNVDAGTAKEAEQRKPGKTKNEAAAAQEANQAHYTGPHHDHPSVFWAWPVPYVAYCRGLFAHRAVLYAPFPATVRTVAFFLASVAFALVVASTNKGGAVKRALNSADAPLTNATMSTATKYDALEKGAKTKIDFLRSTTDDAVIADGALFDEWALVVVAALLGGPLCILLNVPPLIGIMWVALLWANMTGTAFELTDGVTSFMRSQISRLGLVVILARAGLSLDLRALVGDIPRVVFLAFVPLAGEMTVHGLMAKSLFGLDSAAWAMLTGILAAAIAPSVVVPGVLAMRAEGRGVHGGPTTAMLCSVTLDSAVSVWAVSFVESFALDTGKYGTALNAVLGPVQLMLGVLLGAIVGGLIHVAATVLLNEERSGLPAYTEPSASSADVEGGVVAPDDAQEREKTQKENEAPTYSVGHNTATSWIVLVMFLAAALASVHLTAYYQYSGAGSMAVVAQAATVAHLWRKRAPAPPTQNAGDEKNHNEDVEEAGGNTRTTETEPTSGDSAVSTSFAAESPAAAAMADVWQQQLTGLAGTLAVFWDNVVLPALFAQLGASIDVSVVFAGSFFGKSIACLVCGVLTRALLAALTNFVPSLRGEEGAWRPMEVVWLAGSWIGKASVQAAVGSAALTVATEKLKALAATATAAEVALATRNVEQAQIVANTAALAAVIFAPVAALLLSVLGPRCLRSDG